MRLLPKVVWVDNSQLEELCGGLRLYKTSWIKGACDRTNKQILLNRRITCMKHPIINRIDCLLHELAHYLTSSNYEVLDNLLSSIIDSLNRLNEKYIWRIKKYNNRKTIIINKYPPTL